MRKISAKTDPTDQRISSIEKNIAYDKKTMYSNTMRDLSWNLDATLWTEILSRLTVARLRFDNVLTAHSIARAHVTRINYKPAIFANPVPVDDIVIRADNNGIVLRQCVRVQ